MDPLLPLSSSARLATMARQPAPSAAPHLYRWIIDGHNLLLSSARAAGLHGLDRGKEAREALDRWIEAFGRAAGVQLWVVYDGAEVGPRRDVRERPHLRILFTDPPAEADDQIRLLVSTAVRAGELVCVVSSDRKTLGDSLPEEVRLLSVQAFRRLHGQTVKAPEKWVRSEDLGDVERHFLASSPFASDREVVGTGSEPGAETRGADGGAAGEHPDADPTRPAPKGVPEDPR